jgi:hypothetical protein
MRMIAVRIREGQDLKQAIEEVVREQKLPSATVISGVGSLNRARIRMAGASAGNQDIRSIEGPVEIVSLIGNLGPKRTHLHLSVSDKEGGVVGGHLKEDSIVHTTVELVLAVEDSLHFDEEADPQTGFGELRIDSI